MKINSIHIYTMYNTFIIVGETIFFFHPLTELRTDDRRIHHRPGPLDLPVERTLPDPLGERRYPNHLAELEQLRFSTIQPSDVSRASTDANGFRHPSGEFTIIRSTKYKKGTKSLNDSSS